MDDPLQLFRPSIVGFTESASRLPVMRVRVEGYA